MFISNLLRSFIVTANNKSIKDSARQLFITESPLSRRIKILEDKLGCSLFIRGRDGISLTKEGEAIYNAILPYYNDMLSLENTYLTQCNSNKKLGKKNIFNIAVEFGTVDFISECSFFNLDAIDTLTCNYFHGDITAKLLTTHTDIILSNNYLLFDDSLVTCFTYTGMDIHIVKAKHDKNNNVNKIIISGLLSNYLSNIKSDWCEEILKKHNLDENTEVITVHDIMNYRSSIESGETIGVICNAVKDPIENNRNNIKVIPFELNDCDMKININMYFLNEKKTIIEKNFIELFVAA
ncbi:LysR family transcriptional regulator [uncultured Cedecea sp.]|uniref:helix-turn-helix domain-containing protein n=1 Tax=uncultured Cedecea sp. TaxID=988762 RepID=UPI002612A5FF|nr:LysR family transcriptional regulator [uncultured Cedecea sp.]